MKAAGNPSILLKGRLYKLSFTGTHIGSGTWTVALVVPETYKGRMSWREGSHLFCVELSTHWAKSESTLAWYLHWLYFDDSLRP